MTTCAYRSLEPVLAQRIAELRERRARDSVLVRVVEGVYVRRVGRAVGGFVGVLMAVAAFALAVLGDGDHRGIATAVLLLGWPVALLGGAWGRLLAVGSFGHAPLPASTGDAAGDLALLEARDPLRAARDAAASWERSSAAFPLAAASLLAPLTIHFLVYAVFDVAHFGASTFEDFGGWAAISVVIVGHAHLALLVCASRWAYGLRTRATDEIPLDVNRAWLEALLISAGIACLPGIVLLAIPPILVVLTGLLFVPLMFKAMARVVVGERGVLEASP
jgi:hypothetical protein